MTMSAETAPTSSQYAQLTGFQRDILCMLERADGRLYGLAIKRRLEDVRGETVHHGRLYPNLDTLVEDGLINKTEADKRTNNYELTATARTLLSARRVWERGAE